MKEQVWTISNKSGHVFTSLNSFEQVCRILDKFEQAWTNANWKWYNHLEFDFKIETNTVFQREILLVFHFANF